MIKSSNSRTHYYIDTFGPNTEAAKKGFIWLLYQPTIEGYIAVMSKGTFKNAEVYSEAMGSSTVKMLYKENRVAVNEKRIFLAYRPHFQYKREYPILVFYPNKKYLDMIDAMYPSSILVVPWMENELDYWIKKHNAKEIN